MGPTWGRQDPGGPHVGHVNLAIWDFITFQFSSRCSIHERPTCTYTLLCNYEESNVKIIMYSYSLHNAVVRYKKENELIVFSKGDTTKTLTARQV